MADETQTTTTKVKTMWSESLLESLYVALEKNKANKTIIEIIRDLRAKGYQNDYLIEKVQKQAGTTAATRLKGLLTGGGKASAKSGRKQAAPREGPGMLTRIKGIFK
ncbi:MAG: hypothetical protein A2W28_08675 [Gammaproteobacteria bacterium RBG_16_51_14]|nr:MAG: hypothetical protein A2W28_08675 [Gammaproteobacteria bacterium RBG_16_51_14]